MDYPEFVRKWLAGEPLTAEETADTFEQLLDGLDRLIEQLEESEAHSMGAFDERPNITIPDDEKDPKAAAEFRKKWKWDAHEQIIVRGVFTAGDQEEMENASSTLKGKGKRRNIEVKTGSARVKLLERMIVEWTLTKNGRPMAATPENIHKLPANYRKPVLDVCDEIAMTMDEDEQEDFLTGASEPSPES